MIEIPVYDLEGKQVASVQVDQEQLGGEVRPDLLKQAFVRFHANRRQGSAKTRDRSEMSYSTRKLYRQKGTGNARRGSAGTNLMRHGAHGHAKSPHSYRKDMPKKMRRLANRNALLAKLVDGQVKLVDGLRFDKPSTRQFVALIEALQIDRTCLLALSTVTDATALSSRNIDQIDITQIDRLNAYDLLNHKYLLADKGAFEAYLARITQYAGSGQNGGEGS